MSTVKNDLDLVLLGFLRVNLPNLHQKCPKELQDLIIKFIGLLFEFVWSEKKSFKIHPRNDNDKQRANLLKFLDFGKKIETSDQAWTTVGLSHCFGDISSIYSKYWIELRKYGTYESYMIGLGTIF